MSTKALIVGINTYDGCPLAGCVNDSNKNADRLTRKFRFDETLVRMLCDFRATADPILERLEWLVYGAKPGDHLAFCYSGHGALAPSRDGDGQVKNLHSCICPQNFDWTPEHMITHDQLVAIFSKLPRGVKLFWMSDSCHSGILDRDMKRNPHVIRTKAFPMPSDIAWGVSAAIRQGHDGNKVIRDFVASRGFDVAFVPGCKVSQTSADTEIDGVPCGALTHYFWDAQEKLPLTATIKQITDLARENLANDGYNQEPIADGDLIESPIQEVLSGS